MRTTCSPTRRLPVILPSVADEILSSWINRHAAFYGVPPLTMLRHSLPTISSLRSGDLHLTDEQAIDLGGSFATDPKIVREMSLARIAPALHRMVAAGPIQFCPNCASNSDGPAAATRIQYLGWRVTCPSCRTWLCDGASPYAPFSQYFGAALLGEKLFEAEAECRIRTWALPSALARLLMMRRIPAGISSETQLERFRVLGAIIPELDDIVADGLISLPSTARPILPLHLRPALLAGVAMVERLGPAMLEMLRTHTLGENRNRFGNLIAKMTGQGAGRTPIQLQLM